MDENDELSRRWRGSRRELLARALLLGGAGALLGPGGLRATRWTAKHSGDECLPLAATALGQADADEYPVQPYIDRANFLDALRWPKRSYYRQPWRAYLETVPAVQLLAGIGVNYNLRSEADHGAVIRLLVRHGFRSIRLEINWGHVNWDERGFTPRELYGTILAACARHGVKPLILLNANHGFPAPCKEHAGRTLTAAAAAGAQTLQLSSVADLVPGYSGISNLTESWLCEAIVTASDPATNTVTLSKPLPKALARGAAVSLATLKYLPLYPVGTPQFEATAAGWLTYVGLVLDLLQEAGIGDFETEIWNELTFGSFFLSINHYYAPAIAPDKPDFLHAGGPAWELANRTTSLVHQRQPLGRVIWGFSNTTFFHTPIDRLPPGIDGQSYHPYWTNRTPVLEDFNTPAEYKDVIEGFIPPGLVRDMAEGRAQLAAKTEFLPRLINPVDRANALPPDTQTFYHYMTEHGFDPRASTVRDDAAALQFKANAVARALLFWLNKGMSKVLIYCAWDRNGDQGMGMLYTSPNPKDYGSLKEETLASPALQAVQRTIDTFAGAEPIVAPRQLDLDITALGQQLPVFAGDDTHLPLYYREMLTFLPFQVNAHRFVCGLYVMSYDVLNPPPPLAFRLSVKNVNATHAALSLYDPIADQAMPFAIESRDETQVTVSATLVDHPYLLVIDEQGTGG